MTLIDNTSVFYLSISREVLKKQIKQFMIRSVPMKIKNHFTKWVFLSEEFLKYYTNLKFKEFI